jgi:hypothetical protein
MRTLRYLFVILLASVTLANAQDAEKKYGDIKFSGVLYSFYYYNMTNTQPLQNSFPQEKLEPAGLGYNQFDIERIYLNVQSQLSENTAFRFTTDVYRNAAYPGSSASTVLPVVDSTGKKIGTTTVPGSANSSYFNGLAIRVKYGYFDWKPAKDITLRMGLQGTPWFDLVEHAWGYRGVQQTAADKNGFLSSADLGFSAGWNFPDKYGSLTGYIFNGSGYTNPELNRFKDVAAKVEINPMPESETFKGLKLAWFGYWGSNLVTSTLQSSNALANNNMGFLLWYKYDIFNLGVEYDTHTNGTVVAGNVSDSTNTQSVLSIYATIHGPGDLKDWALFGRLDMYKPTGATIPSGAAASIANTNNTLIIAGLSCDISSKVQLALDYQGTSFSNPIAVEFNNATKVSSDARVFLHGIISF